MPNNRLDDDAVLVSADARNRLSLGALVRHRMYRATTSPDGVIVLQPVQVVAVAPAVEG